MTASLDSMICSLSMRERVRDAYWTRRDPIVKDRLQWRARSFRHIMHLLPAKLSSNSAAATLYLRAALLT